MSTVESTTAHRTQPSQVAWAPRPPAGRTRLGDHDFGLRLHCHLLRRGT